MKSLPISFSSPMMLALLAGRKTQTRRTNLEKNYGAAGDHLWVQEAYKITGWSGSADGDGRCGLIGYYVADTMPFDIRLTKAETVKFLKRNRQIGKYPGRFMYRSLSRITLEIIATRTEPLMDISEEDAWQEGVGAADYNCGRIGFISIWESIHGPGDFTENPTVRVIQFKRISEIEANAEVLAAPATTQTDTPDAKS